MNLKSVKKLLRSANSRRSSSLHVSEFPYWLCWMKILLYQILMCHHNIVSIFKKSNVLSYDILDLLSFFFLRPNMALNGLSYVILRPQQLPEVHRLMYQSFHLDEPMTNHLQLCQVIESNLKAIMNIFIRIDYNKWKYFL